MKPILYATKNGEPLVPIIPVLRVEVPLDTPSGTYMAMILDADDSFDLVVQYPDGEREIVFSVVKEAQS